MKTGEIALRRGLSQSQTVKTLIHEYGHKVLEEKYKKDGVPERDRYCKEIEAESTAYIVCQHFGIDSGDYSFGYVLGYLQGRPLEDFRSCLSNIRHAASEIISRTEEVLARTDSMGRQPEARREAALDEKTRGKTAGTVAADLANTGSPVINIRLTDTAVKSHARGR